MDIQGATKAAKKLLTNESLASAVPYISKKASWATQIKGAYNLIYPHIHLDFPRRIETQKYVAERITTSFSNHNSSHRHNGYMSYSFPDQPCSATIISIMKNEKLFRKYGEKIDVKQGGIFETIGYGV